VTKQPIQEAPYGALELHEKARRRQQALWRGLLGSRWRSSAWASRSRRWSSPPPQVEVSPRRAPEFRRAAWCRIRRPLSVGSCSTSRRW